MKFTCWVLVELLTLSISLSAEESAVGMRNRLEELVIRGPEVEVQPRESVGTAIVVTRNGSVTGANSLTSTGS